MEKMDDGLKGLIELGKQRGYLTFTQVNDVLPEDAPNPDRLDKLLMTLEEMGIELIDESEVEDREAGAEGGAATGAASVEALEELDLSFLEEEDELSRKIDDPVRMYLTQMGEIPLLTRDQEINLAKRIEVTRQRFRRKVLECDFALASVVETLTRVHVGELPFDRTVKV
ncbi:MAG TPA: RNA polymerase sigma factor region1.1 domain-containing protein [Gemmatales bacterium]|nr:RNA polymerase sigma factor region1.1 domain-containing protein [Gemmatales bacterium]